MLRDPLSVVAGRDPTSVDGARRDAGGLPGRTDDTGASTP
jgi:hypothetical protein